MKAAILHGPGDLRIEEVPEPQGERGSFHHSPEEVDHALATLANGEVQRQALLGDPIALERLADALGRQSDGRATEWVVQPGL